MQPLLTHFVLFPAMCLGIGFDEVSLFQLHDLPTASLMQDKAQQAETYRAVGELLAANKNLSHSNHIWSYVASTSYAPTLGTKGCLYLPSDKAWRSFYHYVEHPYPPLFAELIANAFDPDCSKMKLGGSPELCPDGHVKGSPWQFLEDPDRSPWGGSSGINSVGQSTGCVGTKHSGVAKGIHIFEAEGHVGLPGKWAYHIDSVKRRGLSRNKRALMTHDKCSESEALPEVPSHKKLVFPTRFVVCLAGSDHLGIDDAMIKQQVEWMNKAYAGKTPWTPESFDQGRAPPQVDMQISFKLKDIKYVTDKSCAQDTFIDTQSAAKYNSDPEKTFTVVIVSDDQSGILGMAEFPTEVPETSHELMVMVSTSGLKGWSSKNGKYDLTYDEGDTAVHEGGHSLGLFHTFEGGCDADGDEVADTAPEEFPTYTCDDWKSCMSADPVHNFMDYTPDTCMAGFTEKQKRRVWCIAKHYRPSLYSLSLTSR